MEHEDGPDGDDIGSTGGLAGTVVEIWWIALLVVILVGVVFFVGFKPGGDDNQVRTDAPAATTTTTTTAPAPTTTAPPAVAPTAPETTVVTTTEVPATTSTSTTAPAPSTSTSTSTSTTTTTTRPEPGRASAALVGCRASEGGTAAAVRITQTAGEPSRFSVTVAFVDPAGNTVARATATSTAIAPGSFTDLTIQIPSGPARGGCLVTGEPAPV